MWGGGSQGTPLCMKPWDMTSQHVVPCNLMGKLRAQAILMAICKKIMVVPIGNALTVWPGYVNAKLAISEPQNSSC